MNTESTQEADQSAFNNLFKNMLAKFRQTEVATVTASPGDWVCSAEFQRMVGIYRKAAYNRNFKRLHKLMRRHSSSAADGRLNEYINSRGRANPKKLIKL